MEEKKLERWHYKKWIKPVIKHGELTKWHWKVSYPENMQLGEFVDIGAFSYLNAHYGITLEDYVQIGGGCQLHTDDTIDNIQGSIILRKNARIGANSVILPNVEIGENSIVGALSLIQSETKIPANEIWGGIPARKIRDLEAKTSVKLEKVKRQIIGRDISQEELQKKAKNIIDKLK